MKETGEITLYDLVITDRATGCRRVLTDRPPAAGRYQAEADLRQMERANRNPNLHYSMEPSRRKAAIQEEWCPERLLTHKFHVH